jgi:hypothetical protein
MRNSVGFCLIPICALVVGCEINNELKNIDYAEYSTTQHKDVIDLVGATDISVCYASDMDTSDRWYKFHLTRDDFMSLVHNVAEQNSGPDPFRWADTAVIPTTWESWHSAPAWWKMSPAKDYKAVSWCYPAESSRFHGWFFYHDGRSDTGFCWHWRYQHAQDMCNQSGPATTTTSTGVATDADF